jgi:hypothetical protein
MNSRVADFMKYAADRGVNVPADRAEALLAEAQGDLDEAGRARRADLVTFPPEVKMANCANCKFVRPGENYCDHEDVDQPLPDGATKMVCRRWDAPGTDRSAQSRDAALERFARPQVEAPTAEPWRYARRTAASTAHGPLPWQQPLPADSHLAGARWEPLGERESGFNPAHRLILPTGERYFVKVPTLGLDPDKGDESMQHEVGIESAVNAVHRLIGMPHVPTVRAMRLPGVRDVEGRPARALLSHHVPGMPYGDAIKRDPRNILRARRANPPDVGAKMYLGNWLVNARDRHAHNYMQTPEGLIVPVDYGVSLFPKDEDDIFGGIHKAPEALVEREGIARHDTPLPKDMIGRALDQRRAVEAAIRQHALPGFTRAAQEGMMRMLAGKFATLSRLARARAPIIGDLPVEPHPHHPEGLP